MAERCALWPRPACCETGVASRRRRFRVRTRWGVRAVHGVGAGRRGKLVRDAWVGAAAAIPAGAAVRHRRCSAGDAGPRLRPAAMGQVRVAAAQRTVSALYWSILLNCEDGVQDGGGAGGEGHLRHWGARPGVSCLALHQITRHATPTAWQRRSRRSDVRERPSRRPQDGAIGHSSRPSLWPRRADRRHRRCGAGRRASGRQLRRPVSGARWPVGV
jgi:hypothetical protein